MSAPPGSPRRGQATSGTGVYPGKTLLSLRRTAPVAGFMSLAAGGYVDFAYIRPAARGRGLFRALYQSIEEKARQGGVRRLWVHASLMAAPAFKAVGFTVLRAEEVTVNGASLRRFEMEKPL
ncbi:MAG: GNAT family N-acetyltransferase [Parvularculaceae bacterium]